MNLRSKLAAGDRVALVNHKIFATLVSELGVVNTGNNQVGFSGL
jgi:hypothetical protein